MITIHAQTQAVTGAKEHEPQVFGHFGWNITPGYIRGWCPPNYPVPAMTTKQLDGTYVSYGCWYSNHDKFWSNEVSTRGI